MLDRRTFVAAAASAGALARTRALAASSRAFPPGFLWGAATAGHQVEGNNVNADIWLLEHVKPTVFSEPSGDADNSFELWATDLDLAKSLGLNSYRFSLEWARIEPEEGQWSIAMLDHYKRIVDGCRARGMTPVVSFNHYTAPRWFSARGNWLNAQAPASFARFCEHAASHLGSGIGFATTFNEPNIAPVLNVVLPPPVIELQRAMLAAASRAAGAPRFLAANACNPEDVPALTRNLIAGHKAGRQAIKSVQPDLPVGVTLSMFDDVADGDPTARNAARKRLYGDWLDVVRGDDFLGVQNYERVRWGKAGRVPPPASVEHNDAGGEVAADSLANAVRYAHEATGLPIMVTEHGVNTHDDAIRARLIPAALVALRQTMTAGVPVKGYIHWSLLDNWEWVAGFKGQLGLCSVDRTTFKRTPKPSAGVLRAIARANAV